MFECSRLLLNFPKRLFFSSFKVYYTIIDCSRGIIPEHDEA